MSTLITCPNCKTSFEPEAAIAQSVEERVRKEFNQKWSDLTKKKDDEIRAREQQLREEMQREQRAKDAQYAEEKRLYQATLQQELQSRIKGDFETQLRLL